METKKFRLNGEEFINAVAERLKDQDIRCYDTNIVSALKELTYYDLNMLIFEGTCPKWHNEKINKLKNLNQYE